MKKTAAICLAFALLALSACQSAPPPQTSPPPPAVTTPAVTQSPAPQPGSTASDYLPLGENIRWVFQGQGSEYASYEVYNDYTAPGRVQQRTDNGGTVLTRVLAARDGALVRTFAAGEVYYRENLLDRSGEEEILLAEPIVAGTSWTLADGRVRTIADTDATVETPSGTYEKVVVVTTVGKKEEGTTTQYYAQGLGVIQTVYKTEDFEVSSTLATVDQNAALTLPVRFYYPSIDDDRVYYEDRDVSFHTNDDTGVLLTEAYRAVPFGLGGVFTENTVINSLTLGDDGAVRLDLSQEFLNEMNAGAGYETLILQSLTNTFAGFYGTDKLSLTVAGKPYASGHIELAQGETLEADFENALPL